MTAAIALFAFGAITAALALSLPLGSLRMPGSGAFPLALGILLMVLAAVQGWSQYKEEQPARTPAPSIPGGSGRVMLFMAIVAAATALMPAIGYLASAFLLMLGLLRVLGVHWIRASAIALVCAVAARAIFVTWLGIPLPAGWLGS
jgi:hypothetical protein